MTPVEEDFQPHEVLLVDADLSGDEMTPTGVTETTFQTAKRFESVIDILSKPEIDHLFEFLAMWREFTNEDRYWLFGEAYEIKHGARKG